MNKGGLPEFHGLGLSSAQVAPRFEFNLFINWVGKFFRNLEISCLGRPIKQTWAGKIENAQTTGHMYAQPEPDLLIIGLEMPTRVRNDLIGPDLRPNVPAICMRSSVALNPKIPTLLRSSSSAPIFGEDARTLGYSKSSHRHRILSSRRYRFSSLSLCNLL